MPCRIALVEDDKGQGWLVMVTWTSSSLRRTCRRNLKQKAEKVRDSLKDVMKAGANGEL